MNNHACTNIILLINFVCVLAGVMQIPLPPDIDGNRTTDDMIHYLADYYAEKNFRSLSATTVKMPSTTFMGKALKSMVRQLYTNHMI